MDTEPSAPLAGRAAAAVVLLVGFYLLALAVAALLVWLPYHQYMYGPGVRIPTAAGAVSLAALIIYSVFPRRDRFVASGPRLREDDAPGLFASLGDIADAVGQPMPAEIYLLREPTIWVAVRGGVMGLGGRRVMGLGLPLLHVLTVPQLRAIFAHELGHFHRGDVPLGPWLHKTRAGFGRSVDKLAEAGVLQAPFRWYGRLFLAVTRPLSEAQELHADLLAARLESGEELARALELIDASAPAFTAFWEQDVLPALAAGFRPPLIEGFDRLLCNYEIEAAIAAGARRQPVDSAGDAHPPLAERLVALRGESRRPAPTGQPRASTLLRDVPALERAFVDRWFGHPVALTELSWDRVGEQVYEESITEESAELAPFLAGMTPMTMPFEFEPLARLGGEILGDEGAYEAADTLKDIAIDSLESGFLGALLASGWKLRAHPGELLTATSGPHEIAPREVLRELYAGNLDGSRWRERCDALGITELDLGRAGH